MRSSDGFGCVFVIYLVFDFDGRMLFSQQLLTVFQRLCHIQVESEFSGVGAFFGVR